MTVALTIMIDGDCPLCVREGRLLMKLDKGRGRLALLDIAAPEFDPGVYGLTHEDVNRRIHAIDGAGGVVEGMEVFRRAYGLLGLGWVLAPTAWPGMKQVADMGYRWFAANRHRLTGRCDGDACDPMERARRRDQSRRSAA